MYTQYYVYSSTILVSQRRTQNLAKHLRAVNYFCKTLHPKYLKCMFLQTNTYLQVFMHLVIRNQREALQLSTHEVQLQLSSAYQGSNKRQDCISWPHPEVATRRVFYKKGVL